MQTWIGKETYNKILTVRDELKNENLTKEPIFLFFKINKDVMGYYYHIINMELGMDVRCYRYYGKNEFLLMGEVTPEEYLQPEYIKYSNRYFKEIKEEIFNQLSLHPIIIISPDFYNVESSILSMNLQNYYTTDGIYIIPPRVSNTTILNQSIICYSDYIEPTNRIGFYSYETEWSIASKILERYHESKNSTFFEVSFPVYLFEDTAYAIKIHLLDCSIGWSSPSFYLEDKFIGAYNYSGSMKPVWLSFETIINYTGLQKFKIILEGGKRQIIRLDIIKITLLQNEDK